MKILSYTMREGGAIRISGSVNISESTFSGNTCRNPIDGGGDALYINQGSSVSIEDCTFSENICYGSSYHDHKYGGGAIYCAGSSLEITDSSFISNSFYRQPYSDPMKFNGGGGIYLHPSGGSETVIMRCEFDTNVASLGGASLEAANNGGGALFLGRTCVVSECTFINNSFC